MHCFPELLLVNHVELIKENLFSIAEQCNSLVSCSLVLSHVPLEHLLSVQVVCFRIAWSRFFDNHEDFVFWAGFLLVCSHCINCCSQFSKDTLMSLLLISLTKSVLSTISQALLKSECAYLHIGLGWDHTCCWFYFHLSHRRIPFNIWLSLPKHLLVLLAFLYMYPSKE